MEKFPSTIFHIRFEINNNAENNIDDITVFSSAEFKSMKELYLDYNKIDSDLYFDIINYLKSKITIYLNANY